jgi:hypothetical protein
MSSEEVASARPLAVNFVLRWGLLEAILGCDLGDGVVITSFNVKDLVRRSYSTSTRFA